MSESKELPVLKEKEVLDLNDPKVRKFGRTKPIHIKLDYNNDPKVLLKDLEEVMKKCNPMNFEDEDSERETAWIKVMEAMLKTGKLENLVLWSNIENRLKLKHK
jgi:hypothetical protein